MDITPEVHAQLLEHQKNEITEYHIYLNLSKPQILEKPGDSGEKLLHEELRHYHVFKKYTRKDVEPDRFKIWKYYWISRIFGLTFGLKLMENGEERAQKNYEHLLETIPEISTIIEEENKHENALLGLIDEEWLNYICSVVLGLNDALVELTGALAGFTLALQDTKLIALTGSLAGIAAALSMGASEYLSTKAEGTDKTPPGFSLYWGCLYFDRYSTYSTLSSAKQLLSLPGLHFSYRCRHHRSLQLLYFSG